MYTKKFLYDEICDWFITLYKRSDDKKQVFNDKKVLRLYDLITEEDTVKRAITFMSNHIAKEFPTKRFYIKNIELVEWNEGQGMDWHRDYPYYEGTSIIFLNDDYEGGELITANDAADSMKHTRIIHPPEKGAIVSFLNMLWHKVNPVTKGKRYTLAVWYDTL
tara:strand:- start:59 stop:547 length:489 start_codon:yes stop_codon:yes gene_type:complete